MKYSSGGERLMGIAIPLASIRTREGWRVGEYPDLVPFCGLCKELGAGLVQLLPVNDTGGQSSPYSALSACALHPLYIRVRDLPEAAAASVALPALDAFAAKARPGERFPYDEAYRVKMAALHVVFDSSQGAILADPALKAFIKANPWVKTYAVYRNLKARNGERPWREWDEWRDPAPGDVERLWADRKLHDEHAFYAWTQMRAAEQFAAASNAAATMGVALLGDLPILMNEDSADVWASRSFFDLSMRAGAPPDMYSANGQNWGFPVYDWDAMAADGYSFWKARIAEADKYYAAYRIDHVLGFFRIWALGEREETGYLGRFLPGPLLSADELARAGFSAERQRWLSLPHARRGEIAGAASEADLDAAIAAAFDRLGSEDLYLFKPSIRGERDITALGLGPALADGLKARWRDRCLLPVGQGRFAPTWRYRESKAWGTLSDDEKRALEGMIAVVGDKAEAAWAERGRRLLSMLSSSSAMLPCAEDLGVVPACVPRVLGELGIPGLRVPRWMRRWSEPGSPFIPLDDYSVLAACTPSVHDTSTLRGWWEKEDGRAEFAAAYCPALKSVPERLSPEAAAAVLEALAGCPSTLFVTQVQDLLDLSSRLRSKDPDADRINVPGTVNDFNWTWRMGPSVEDAAANDEWKKRVRKIAEAR